jgi:hypothetical protein
VPNHFTARVGLYSRLDQKLSARTRFFGAAALINAVLAEWCSMPYLGQWTSGAAVLLLSRAGAHLEHLNVMMAAQLESRERDGDLDHCLVATEQTELQRLLQSHALTQRPRYLCAVRQINQLLSWAAAGRVPLRHRPSVELFGAVVSRLQHDLGRPVDFAMLDDRIGIGLALTQTLRGAFHATSQVPYPT